MALTPQMMILLAAGLWSVWAVAMRPLSQELGPTGAAMAMWLVYGAGGLLLWSVSPSFAGEAGKAAAGIGAKGWALASLAAIPAMAAILLFAMGIQGGVKIGVATGISSAYPAMAALLAWVIFGESLDHRQWAGLLLVGAGGWMLAR